MKNDAKERMIRSISGFRLPRYAELPNVGLYLEQTVKFINYYLKPLGGPELTASMVSNYVKQKLISNPQKKQYYTEHIAYLMFITVTKAVLTLEDIRLMFVIQRENYPLEAAYDYFCDELETMLNHTFEITKAPDHGQESQANAKDFLRNTLLTVVHKIYLEKYLESFREILSATPSHPQEWET